ncbi:hypothetical protein V8C40DRAFT_249585 [Trichoderma camerunense]
MISDTLHLRVIIRILNWHYCSCQSIVESLYRAGDRLHSMKKATKIRHLESLALITCTVLGVMLGCRMLNMYFGLCLFEVAFLLSLMPLSMLSFLSFFSPFFF